MDISRKKKNSKKFKLFSPGDWCGNVELNWIGAPEHDFPLYARAFHRAGKDLIESMEGYVHNDLQSLPVVFLYRHSLELYIKGIVITGFEILSLSGEKVPAKKIVFSHKISSMLSTVERIFRAVGWEGEGETGIKEFQNFNDIKKLVNDIEKIDPGSYSFRYPIKKNGSSSLPKRFFFNLFDYVDLMDKLLNLLDGACLGLEVMFDDMCEAFEYMSDLRIDDGDG